MIVNKDQFPINNLLLNIKDRPRIAWWRLKDRPVTVQWSPSYGQGSPNDGSRIAQLQLKDEWLRIFLYLTYAVKEPDNLLVGPFRGDEVEGQEPAV